MTPNFHSQRPNPQLPGVFDISAADVYAHRNDITIVDVRRPEEWVGEHGHIAEANLVTLHKLPSQLDELQALGRTLVFVCLSGGRSAQATAYATQQGATSAFNMLGGMMEWSRQNLPAVERSED